MTKLTLPSFEEMYRAVERRDTSFDGIFFTAVKTTGIFCRPTCSAKLPYVKNVEFYATVAEAMSYGFRPCKRCCPLEPRGVVPKPIEQLLAEIEIDPSLRLTDMDLRQRGHDPATLRRWFKSNFGMTFQAYHRSHRLSKAMGELSSGAKIAQTAFDSGYESLSGFQDALHQITGRSASKSRDSRVVHLSRMVTPLGPMLTGATDSGICLLEFSDRPMLETQILKISKKLNCVFLPGSNEFIFKLEEELKGYFAGTIKKFKTPLVFIGSDFQKRTWNALCQIDYGKTRSYSEQARMIGSPDAVRAVARANGENSIAIVVPCHRVVGSNGTLTGYGGGLFRKKWLLEHEGAVVAKNYSQTEFSLK